MKSKSLELVRLLSRAARAGKIGWRKKGGQNRWTARLGRRVFDAEFIYLARTDDSGSDRTIARLTAFGIVLDDTVEFPGIVSLPLDTVKQAFRRQFPQITDDGGSLDYEGHGSYFQVGFTFLDERTVSRTGICCGYDLVKSPEAMQRLSDVAALLRYRVYDPQQE